MKSALKFTASSALGALLCSGCASPPVETLRSNYYAGNYDRALVSLEEWPEDHRDSVLCHLERGMVHHARNDYSASTRDWLAAVEISGKLDYLSLNKSGQSLIVNDRIRDYRGAPFERTLSRSFLALNYLGLRQWDDAAVEGRNIHIYQESMAGYPEDAFSRYVAALTFELIGDRDNARIQYAHANRISPYLDIDPQTGHLSVTSPEASPAVNTANTRSAQLICISGLGRTDGAPGWYGNSPYVEISSGNKALGRTLPLSNTSRLWHDTRKKRAALEAAKTVTRIALKDAVADVLAEENELAGELLRLIFFAYEVPDNRRWKTLPLWLTIGRMDYPNPTDEVTLTFRSADGHVIETQTRKPVFHPAANLYVVFAHSTRR